MDTTAEPDVTTLISGFDQLAERFVAGLFARFAALSGASVELENLRTSLAAEGTSLPTLMFEIVLVVALVAGVPVQIRRASSPI
ncbi:hypothetical protein NKI96_00975 [Mesorhizobium sp. M0292]|uniref:hypothetical protein n=1 Tax=Mesorhizobium sp. M0292 TaxID=2956929 RepID=UPI0003D00695|nr:hypothetical protein [Mesorhizobium sp. L2C054A000]ESZ33929.1 hypothetical protein X731_31480 [Mesorhizobium sp. L2C054A000]